MEVLTGLFNGLKKEGTMFVSGTPISGDISQFMLQSLFDTVVQDYNMHLDIASQKTKRFANGTEVKIKLVDGGYVFFRMGDYSSVQSVQTGNFYIEADKDRKFLREILSTVEGKIRNNVNMDLSFVPC